MNTNLDILFLLYWNCYLIIKVYKYLLFNTIGPVPIKQARMEQGGGSGGNFKKVGGIAAAVVVVIIIGIIIVVA